MNLYKIQKKTLFLFCLISLFFLKACAQLEKGKNRSNKQASQNLHKTKSLKTEAQRLNEFFEESFELSLKRSPMRLTYVGRKEQYDKLNDFTDGFQEKELEIKKEEIKELKKFNFKTLDKKAQMNYRLFLQNRQNFVSHFKYRFYNYPINQMFGFQKSLPAFMINFHRINNLKDAKDYISRLRDFRRVFREEIENLKTRSRKGIEPPRFVFPKAIEDSKNLISGYPFENKNKKERITEQSPLYKDFMVKIKKLKNIRKKDKAILKKSLEEVLKAFVLPAYLDLIRYLEIRLKFVKKNQGLWQFGDEVYKSKIKEHTTTNLTPEEIHKIGLTQVDRIHKEMKALMKRMSFHGSLQDLFRFFKNDSFFYSDTDQGRQAYLLKTKQIIQEMKERLPQFFSVLPQASIKVKPIEKFREKSSGIAFYRPPSEDGKRPGVFFINLSRIKSLSKYEMQPLAYHEAVPGHHLERSLAIEIKNKPSFRRYAFFTAFIEGWGLYAETLPKEIGLYKDLHSEFGFLNFQLMRAARLVVDTGIHKYRWTREQAIDYLEKNTLSSSTETFKRSVERYFVLPGQATAYMIGMLKIMELRKKAETKLKSQFDKKTFHDEILRNGPLPLNILEEVIDEFIQRNLKSKND